MINPWIRLFIRVDLSSNFLWCQTQEYREAVYQAQEEVCQEREIRTEICRRQRVPIQGNRIRRRATGRKPNQEDKESKEEQEKG